MKLHEMKNRTKIQLLKELEVADERWKSNEKYRERYMDGYVEERLSWEQDLIEKIEERRNNPVVTSEQANYNIALSDIIKIIMEG